MVGARPTMNPPSTLRELLQAEITSLEEAAGELKGLAELKLSVAEDKESPPHNAEGLRQKAREHKCHAIGVLMAKKVLEVALNARTKEEQIALMQHYVLDFGQDMSRNARLANSLPDDDPRKEEVDDTPAPPHALVVALNKNSPPRSTTATAPGAPSTRTPQCPRDAVRSPSWRRGVHPPIYIENIGISANP